MKKNDVSKQLTTFPMALAYCRLSRIFRSFIKRKEVTFLAVLVIKDKELTGFYETAAEFLLKGKSSYGIRRLSDEAHVETINRGKARYHHVLGLAQNHTRVVLIFDDEDDVPQEFRAAADVFEVIAACDKGLCQAALYRMCGKLVSEEDAKFVLEQPWRRTAATLRKGRSVERALKLLRRSSLEEGSLSDPVRPAAHKPIGVEDLVGYGDARDWGLGVVRDLSEYRAGRLDWGDVDPGLLLSGPPGCGKTRFAHALATSCGVPLIHGSAAVWQSAGHMGDMLREMRNSFDDAIANAPSILLIDEMDSFGNRATVGHQHRDYVREVINGALECLDGAIRRTGVIVIGTTNFPEFIDPAFLRPGRLDRHIRLSLPDAETRLEILARYLGFALSAAEALHVVLATEEWTGAQLEQLARDTRRRARLGDRKVVGPDVIASLPEMIAIPEHRIAVASIHECGHVIVGLALGREIDKIRLADRYLLDADRIQLGGVHFRAARSQHRTLQFYLDEISISLGGIAAEEEVIGTYDDGAGGSLDSDLVNATRLATLIEGVYGMGGTLVSEVYERHNELPSLRFRSPGLWKRIDLSSRDR